MGVGPKIHHRIKDLIYNVKDSRNIECTVARGWGKIQILNQFLWSEPTGNTMVFTEYFHGHFIFAAEDPEVLEIEQDQIWYQKTLIFQTYTT